jgi:chorismate mutase
MTDKIKEMVEGYIKNNRLNANQICQQIFSLTGDKKQAQEAYAYAQELGA